MLGNQKSRYGFLYEVDMYVVYNENAAQMQFVFDFFCESNFNIDKSETLQVYLSIKCTFIADFSLLRLFGRVVSALFGRRPSARQQSRQRGPLDFRIQPILTLDERESPRTVSRPRFANQLSNDGATGLSVNQLGDLEDSRDDGFRQFGSTGVCRQNFHCSGSERCVKRNGEFM